MKSRKNYPENIGTLHVSRYSEEDLSLMSYGFKSASVFKLLLSFYRHSISDSAGRNASCIAHVLLPERIIQTMKGKGMDLCDPPVRK